MKIKPEHYNFIKEKISVFKNDISYIRSVLALDKRIKDLEMRLRWDLFYKAGLSRFACDHLYQYLNDTHIDTALKSIMKEFP